MTNELSIVRTFDDAERAAKAMAQSGFFPDSKQAAQAIVKILAGQELGFGPFASMTGVSIIQGKPTLGANFLAAAVKRTGKYNYRVVEMTDQACEIAFFEAGQEVGRSRFTVEDAKKASLTGKDNWTKYPRNMLFARAISNGVRWYTPDIFNGANVYTPDELGAVVNEDGEVIEVKAVEATAAVIPVEHDAAAPIPQNGKPDITVALAHLAGICTKEGDSYLKLDSKTLSGHIIGLRNLLKENHLTDDKRAEYKRKLDAAVEIENWRLQNEGAA